MFSKSAKFYNALYRSMGKDYAAESQKAHELIQNIKRSNGNMLLEVACGTGLHISTLREHYMIEGLDLDSKMLAIARETFPDIPFHHADMVDFDLSERFDAITCLFSSIGYVKTKERLNRAIQNMARHLMPGGVLIVEPWFTPEHWQPGGVYTLLAEEADLKIFRMSSGGVNGYISFIEFHYMVGTSEGIKYFKELHELGLFTHEEYLGAFHKADLDVTHDPEGLDGRGLYIGLKT